MSRISAFGCVSGTVPSGFDTAISFVQFGALANHTFSGTLPASWGASGELYSLTVVNSLMSGSLPELPPDRNRLRTYLSAWSPHFEGTLPAGFMNASHVSFAASKMSGTISPSWFASTRLKTFVFSGNSVSGTLPLKAISPKASKILRMRVVRNDLSGSVPSEFGSLTSLRQFAIGYNPLSGTLPAEMQAMSLLQHTFSKTAKLSGTLPDLPNSLESLIFSFNRLSGSLSSSFNHSSVKYLDLSFNRLTGDLSHYTPPQIVRTMFLHSNRFSGTLPAWSALFADGNRRGLPADFNASQGSQLYALLLYSNDFSGTVPGELIGNAPELTYLSYSLCAFSGTLPSQMCSATSLRAFAANDMKFSGKKAHVNKLEHIV